MDDTLFVLRRAWLFGVCRRSDVNAAFDTRTSPNAASNIMNVAAKRWRDVLYKVKYKGIFPRKEMPTPEMASGLAVLNDIARGAPPKETGVFPNDGVPILMPEPKAVGTMTKNGTTILTKAALLRSPVRIFYVGLKRNEEARWRRLWPLALEFTGLDWRLHAQDLDRPEEGFPAKVYVLARMLDVETLSRDDVPGGFIARNMGNTTAKLRVSLSEALTNDQKTVIRHQFDIKDGIFTWPTHAVHAFKREFVDAPIPREVVWPIITRLDEE